MWSEARQGVLATFGGAVKGRRREEAGLDGGSSYGEHDSGGSHMSVEETSYLT